MKDATRTGLYARLQELERGMAFIATQMLDQRYLSDDLRSTDNDRMRRRRIKRKAQDWDSILLRT